MPIKEISSIKKIIIGAATLLLAGGIAGLVPIGIAIYKTVDYVDAIKTNAPWVVPPNDKRLDQMQVDMIELRSEVKILTQFMISEKARKRINYVEKNNPTNTNVNN